MEIKLTLIFLIFAIIQFDLVSTYPQAGYRATNEEARDSLPTATSILGPVEPLEVGGENESGKDGTQRSARDVVVIDEAERHRPRRPYGGGRDRYDRFDRYGGEFGDRYDRYGGRGGRYGGDRFGTGGIYGSRGIYEEVHPVLIPEPIPIPHPVPIPEPVPVPILAPSPSLLPPPIILRNENGKKMSE